MPRSSPLLLLLLLLLTACISQSPPAPPVRWFDPLPAATAAMSADAVPAANGPAPRVVAVPFLRQEFVVRTGERELAIDGGNRWIAPPEQLVAHVLRDGAGAARNVVVERFELDLRGEPRAVVALRLESDGGSRTVVAEAAAQGTSPEQFAAAMAAALLRARDLAGR